MRRPSWHGPGPVGSVVNRPLTGATRLSVVAASVSDVILDLADLAPTPAALLDVVRDSRRAADDAERHVLVAAAEWAHMFPAHDPADRTWQVTTSPGFEASELDARAVAETTEEGFEWFALPPVAWDAPAAFAAANNMPETSARP